ncbi:MAG: Phenylalanine-tRNA ligase beta subunit [Parcubacteria group bacterium GW2011_GWA2_47_12]|nr:MAG: Phenylalanine-tRNA ligase beta subunit [Parcubacteria group bacterium GW2011_GWA2_47_12]
MLISYNWLQSYFKKKLPPAEEVAERLAFSFAEVEGLEKKNGDTILDVKVLPDRACYALSHMGVAGEAAALCEIEADFPQSRAPRVSRGTRIVSVRNEEPTLCTRYTARAIENISVEPSPAWLRERLEAIGQRSINNIVDATNFVMFDTGQPLHAFDADKVRGGIIIRKAKIGERMKTLDGKELSLDVHALVIADDEGPLALAGVKGGARAEVTKDTRAVILEAASFNASMVRRASEKFGIKTESSRRFENRLSAELALEGSDACAELIQRMQSGVHFGKLIDRYPKKEKKRSVSVSVKFVRDALGLQLSEKEMLAALARLALPVRKRGDFLVVSSPPERLDLVRQEDFVEEIGRIVGLERIPETQLPAVSDSPSINKRLFYEDKIRDLLVAEGFSEVLTSSFAAHGDIAIEKPLASDKAFCRRDLWTNFHHALIKNYSNVPLLESEEIKQFEIGKVFTTKREHLALIIGCMPVKKSVSDTVHKVEKIFGVPLRGKFCGGDNVYECTI